MNEFCRVCAQELCGNKRRWIFHTVSRLNLQVVLSHVLGKEVSRNGKAEFVCSKCTFMLDRVYRFDTVIARIEALSIERLQKLIVEKDKLKQCLANLYRKNNCEEDYLDTKFCEGIVDVSNLSDMRYSALLRNDFVYSSSECWTELEEQDHEQQHCPHSDIAGIRPRRCHCCSALRVVDSDYEAVCKVPRKVSGSVAYGPSTKYSASMCNEDVMVTQLSDIEEMQLSDGRCVDKMSSGSSVESIPSNTEIVNQAKKYEETLKATINSKDDCFSNNSFVDILAKMEMANKLVKTFKYRPIQTAKGSKIPIKLHKPIHLTIQPTGVRNVCSSVESTKLSQDFVTCDLPNLWQEIYDDYMPLSTKIASEALDQVMVCKNCKLKEQQNANVPHGIEYITDKVISAESIHPPFMRTSSEKDVLKTAGEEKDATETLRKELSRAKEDLQLVLRKEQKYQLELSGLQAVIHNQREELQVQAADMDSLSRNIHIKEDLIKVLQMQLVDPEEMPTVERLTKEVLALKEKFNTTAMNNQDCVQACSYKLTELFEGFAGDSSRLNQVLEIERQLCRNLMQFHTNSNCLISFHNSTALQTELQTAQILRSQLENTLAKATELMSHLQSDDRASASSFGVDSVVEKDSKHVQVDLQDLGYETCDRSETEAEMEGTTSPEYDEQDDLFSQASIMEGLHSPQSGWSVLSTSSTTKTKHCLLNDWNMYRGKSTDHIVLQQHSKDLKDKLHQSQKYVRNQQNQTLSFSVCGDCASKQKHLKHSVSIKGSPLHGTKNEDDSWKSDMTAANSTKDLENLVQRVSILEAYLQPPTSVLRMENEKRSSIRLGKYDSLIQAQARELSLLRQNLREGQRVGHVLNHYISDTIKSFEELLRVNDIDYYMGQDFRDQLAEVKKLAELLYSKLDIKEHLDDLEVDDKLRNELPAIRLSKELQKDKIMETLQSMLNICLVASSTSTTHSDSNQSDTTSFVPTDYLFASEDSDAFSEVASTVEEHTSMESKDYSVELANVTEQPSTSRVQLNTMKKDQREKKLEKKAFQEELEGKKQVIFQLLKEQLANQEENNRLQHQLTLLQQQLNENCQLLKSLQSKLQVYEHLCGTSAFLSSGMNCNPSHSVKQVEGHATDGSFANKNGYHVIGHINDFNVLKQQMLEEYVLMKNIQALMQSSLNIPFLEMYGIEALDYGSIKKLFSCTSTMQKNLEASISLIDTFWRATLPTTQSCTQEKQELQATKVEIWQLKAKLQDQEEKYQVTSDHLKSINHANEIMESIIVSQVIKTHEVLKKARLNLQVTYNSNLQKICNNITSDFQEHC